MFNIDGFQRDIALKLRHFLFQVQTHFICLIASNKSSMNLSALSMLHKLLYIATVIIILPDGFWVV